MKLIETAPLAQDLERGLGEVHPLLAGINSEARLGMAVCGIVSVALSETLTKKDVDHELVISKPQLEVDPHKEHVFVVVKEGGDETVIDATYAQFYDYAGVSPGFLSMSGRSRFNFSEKIISFPLGAHDKVVERMSLQAKYFVNHYVPTDELPFQRIDFKDMDEDEIAGNYARIWEPERLEPFVPTDFTRQAGEKLASFIVAEHVKLVA